MAESRQHYNEDFKKKTVKYVQEQTKSLPEIAQELDIPVGTIRQWLSKYREFENEPMASIDRVRELEQLLKVMEQENVDLKEELAIVKKAVHIFSKPRS
jgi:transposase